MNTDPVDETMAPACPVLMDKLQFLQPDDVDRILGLVKATICLLDLCLSWFVKAAREGPRGSKCLLAAG